ncbi:MAG: hypothetical protein ABI725_02110 [Chloroflexota bacterium]
MTEAGCVGSSVGALVWAAVADGWAVLADGWADGGAGVFVATGLGDWAAMPQPAKTIVRTTAART